jgi:fructose transport system substrate-binding protein
MKYLPNRRGTRLGAALALTAAASLVFAACGGGGNSGSAGGEASQSGGGGGEKVAVTLITKDNQNPYWISMQKSADEAAAKDGITLTKAAGAKDGDEDGQVKAIEAAVARGDKGILIAPNGPGVNDAISNARNQGVYVLALDTVPDPPDTADGNIATDNFKAGQLIGQWMAGSLAGKDATIAMLDLNNKQIITVDIERDQGFLTGMGIDTKDKNKNGDEDPSGKYTGGKGGNYTIVCHEPTLGASDTGKTAMENCLSKSKAINTVYTINEPSAAGAADALDAAGVKATIVSVDGGCSPGIQLVKAGTVGATSQQYPGKMAEVGLESIKKMIDTKGAEGKPQNGQGLDFQDSGVALVTDKPVQGVPSITSDQAAKVCWGGK